MTSTATPSPDATRARLVGVWLVHPTTRQGIMIRYISEKDVDWYGTERMAPKFNVDIASLLLTMPTGKAAVIPLVGQTELAMRNRIHSAARRIGCAIRIKMIAPDKLAVQAL